MAMVIKTKAGAVPSSTAQGTVSPGASKTLLQPMVKLVGDTPPSSPPPAVTPKHKLPTAPSTPDAPLTIHAKAGQGTELKEYKDGSVAFEQSSTLEVVKSASPMASVHMSISVTRNLGNYESVKLTVGLTLPCDPVPQEIDDTYDSVKEWVDARIEALNNDVSSQLG